MNKNLEVLQNGFRDCGPSCLLSVIRYYGGDASHEEITLILKTDINGTSAYNLINGAKSLGFDGYGIKYTCEDIINSNITFPIITHVMKKNMYHFIVIYGVDKRKLYIMDPDIGNTKITIEEFEKIYQGTSIVLYPVKRLPTLDNLNSITSYFKSYIYEEKKDFVTFSLLSILIVIIAIVSNYYMSIIIDVILPNYEYKRLLIISYLFLNILWLKCLLSYIRGKYLLIITNNIGIKMNNETIRHIFNLPYQFFKNKSTGEVLSRVSDIKRIKDIFSNIIVNMSIDAVLIVLSMIVLLLINNRLFLISLISILIYFLIVFIYSKVFKKQINIFQTSDGEYNKILTESIEGYETNKNINMINYINKKIETKFIIYSKKKMSFDNSLNNQNFLKDLVMNTSYIITIIYGVILINSSSLSLGNFIVYNSILTYFIEPIKNILDLEPNLNYLKGIYNRLNDLLIMKSKSINESDIMVHGDIFFNNVSYSYNNKDLILNDISFNIKYGSKFLIYGSSGNGKSTLLKLLLKYMNDYKGSIKIDSINLLDIDESLISSSFTYVSQNNYLNNDTLKNNIIYDRSINDNEYEKVIDICHINKLRDSKSLRNDFVIEDNGFNISGGERQKIILARALLKRSNYLILDEALSEVGFIEEKEIINKIIDYYKDKTIIYVSHKKEIIELFDSKYCLERS